MDVIELIPGRLLLLRFPVGQAYLWRDADELTLIDAGPAGSGARIADAVRELGGHPGDVRRVVLTHWHEDHADGAGELAELTGAQVLVHAADAPMVRGLAEGPPPVLADWERPLLARARELLPDRGDGPVRPVHPSWVTELTGGEILPFGGGAHVVPVPGHTDGSIAVHLPSYGVLFTGDTVAASPVDGSVVPGVFNVDRARLLRSFDELAHLDAELACFGHGGPVLRDASAVLRDAVRRSQDPPTGTPASR